MGTVTAGRRWPAGLPFATVRSGDGFHRHGEFVAELRPGDFQFKTILSEPTDDPLGAIQDRMGEGLKGYARLAFVCPRTGKPCAGGLGLIIGHPEKPALFPSWHWDGDTDRPTLSPSVNCTGGCGWHGWLQAGEFREC